MLTACLVLDASANPSPAAISFRNDLPQLLESHGFDVRIASPSDAASTLADLPPEALVILEARAWGLIERHGLDPHDVWLLALPTTFRGDPAATSWSRPLLEADAALQRVRYLTDSEVSRDEIEAVLKHRRVEVVVLPRILASAGETSPIDTFEALKELSPAKAAAMSVRDRATSEDRWAATWPDLYEAPDLAAPATSWDTDLVNGALARLAPDKEARQIDKSVAILGANLNFVAQLADRLALGHVRRVETQEWKYLSAPTDADAAQHLLDTADVCVAEWIRPSAKWIAEHAPFDKPLIVRGHRYEVTTDFPNMVDMTRYDAAVVITPWVGRELVQKFGWPKEKIVYIPNYVESDYFNRPKLAGAEFTLGVVGIRPALKRVDLALDLLASLREVDPRYNLRIRSASPFDYINWHKEPAARAQWEQTLARVRHDPILRGAVFFDEPGQDMSSWLRQIGVILSLSDIEGSHVALAEGVSSGSFPIARPWPGIKGIWPEQFAYESLATARDAILRLREADALEAAATVNMRHPSLDAGRVLTAWKELIAGNILGAREVFGVIDTDVHLEAPHTYS